MQDQELLQTAARHARAITAADEKFSVQPP
jgi:hypothetical protein